MHPYRKNYVPAPIIENDKMYGSVSSRKNNLNTRRTDNPISANWNKYLCA